MDKYKMKISWNEGEMSLTATKYFHNIEDLIKELEWHDIVELVRVYVEDYKVMLCGKMRKKGYAVTVVIEAIDHLFEENELTKIIRG